MTDLFSLLPTIVLWAVIICFIAYGFIKLRPYFKGMFSQLKSNKNISEEINQLKEKIENEKQLHKLQSELNNLKEKNA